jgi:methylated-DNA-[protein]-cysteine S-methyltransferase
MTGILTTPPVGRSPAGATTTVRYTVLDGPLGPLVAAATSSGLVGLHFAEDGSEPVVTRLARRLSAVPEESPSALADVRRQLEDYLDGRRREFDLPLDWSLTAGFARRALEATAAIPYGEVRSYRQVAAAAGSPRAARAVGAAMASNPLAVVVPCHRVVGSSGSLIGYGGGLERKRTLLRLEGILL